MQLLEELFPGKYEINYDRDVADYVYEVEQMISLKGKKLHGKRNHINKFKENNPHWSYESLTKENLAECIAMSQEWKRENLCGEKDGKHGKKSNCNNISDCSNLFQTFNRRIL